MWLEQLQQHRFYRQNQLNLSGNTANEDNSPTSLKSFHSPRGSLPRGLMPNNAPKSLIQEFNQMDERMQNQLLSIQQHAVNLGLLAQKFEDDVPMATSSKQKHFFGLRKKKSGSGSQNGSTMREKSSESRSSTLTSLQGGPNERPQSPSESCDLTENSTATSSAGSLANMAHLSSSNPSIGEYIFLEIYSH